MTDAEKQVAVFNKTFPPGQSVQVEKKEYFFGRTIGPALLNSRGEAVVIVEGLHGAVPLSWVTPRKDEGTPF